MNRSNATSTLVATVAAFAAIVACTPASAPSEPSEPASASATGAVPSGPVGPPPGEVPPGEGSAANAPPAPDPETQPPADDTGGEDGAPTKKPPNDGIPKLGDLDIPETIPVGTSDEDARVIVTVDGIVAEEAEIERCGFLKGGKTLAAGGRVDVLECVYSEGAEYVTSAHLIIRPTDRTDDLVVDEIASVTMVPGEEGTYSLGKLSAGKDKISIQAKIKVLTIGNTGDPEGPEDNSVERWTEKLTCVRQDGVWSCEKDSP